MLKSTPPAWVWLTFTFLVGGCSDGSNSPAANLEINESPPVEAPDPCFMPADDIVVAATESGIEYVRTPEPCFDALVDFPYAPNYAVVDGLRVHYIDEGPRDGEVVLMLHGQPSWSYLYRKMIPVLTEAGFRVIAADHIGMGRSDKPVDPRTHTYEQQVEWNRAFITGLGLEDVTLFVQDWGSLIGLRIAGEMPHLFARIVIANGDLPGIPPGLNPFTAPAFEFDESVPGTLEFFAGRSREPIAAFQEWIEFAASATELFAADVVQIGSAVELSDAELAAYDAPFPDPVYWGAIRSFPSMVSGINGETLPAIGGLSRYDKPFLALAGEFDPGLGSEATQGRWIDTVPGARGQEHRRYGAGHFIQEDVGAQMAADVVAFMRANPIPRSGPLFKARYCEILLVSTVDDAFEARVYNTLGLNPCPQIQWDAIDVDEAAMQAGALAAVSNGPRYWVLDRITPIENGDATPIPGFGDVSTFGALEMRLVATLLLDSIESGENEPYVIKEVERSTVFTFVAGRRIFELEDADGGRYVMQSMSQVIDPEQQLHDLVSLDERLTLPEGWSFSTRVLTEDLRLTANGLARVIVDDLSNTYQKVE